MLKICNDAVANRIFENLSKISPDFNDFVISFFSCFNNSDVNPSLIDKYGLIAIQTGIELEKIVNKIKSSNLEDYNNLIINSIVLVYGYSQLFNQVIDEGIIEHKLITKIKDYAKLHNIDELIFLSNLDLNFHSILTKRFLIAKKIMLNKDIRLAVCNLLVVKDLFNDSKMQEVELELKKLYSLTNLKNSAEFRNYLNLFNMNYFQFLPAVRLLQQVKEHNLIFKKHQSIVCVTSDFKQLAQLFIQLKKWKDISGIETNKNQLRLYFEILDGFAKTNKMGLYLPIDKFLNKAKRKLTKYRMEFNLEKLDEAKTKFKAWNSILEN